MIYGFLSSPIKNKYRGVNMQPYQKPQKKGLGKQKLKAQKKHWQLVGGVAGTIAGQVALVSRVLPLLNHIFQRTDAKRFK